MSQHITEQNKDVNLFIDGIPVTVPEGTTILDAARKVNVKIPTLCDHPALGKRALCRICVVECDGRGKLLASCSQDVWEGVHVVTNNHRLRQVRKTIIELLMANHPNECLSCARNGNCELQTLAKIYGEPFSSNDNSIQRVENTHITDIPTESSEGTLVSRTIVRDMRKCVKCGRCVEACQAVRAINTSYRSIHFQICTPYKQALEEGPCIFCGLCAQVCPVGAIVEYDQSGEVLAALNSGRHLIATVSASICAMMDDEFGLPRGTITKGKIAAVLKLMGFEKVFDTAFFVDQFIQEKASELLDQIQNSGNLPMILSCSPAVSNFVEAFYPELKNHLPSGSSPEQHFGTQVKNWYNKTFNVDMPEIAYVSIMPCIAKKHGGHNIDFALSGRELVRMIRTTGIALDSLPETPFDTMTDGNADIKSGGQSPASTEVKAIIGKVFSAYTAGQTPGEMACLNSSIETKGITETELIIGEKTVKILFVNGLANAHIIMDSIRKGECAAALVCVMSCLDCGSQIVS